jgi:hypothetical protein
MIVDFCIPFPGTVTFTFTRAIQPVTCGRSSITGWAIADTRHIDSKKVNRNDRMKTGLRAALAN